MYINIRQVLLLKFAFKPEGACQAVLHDYVKRLVNGFHIEALGRRSTIGQYDTITAESAIVGDIAEVTSVCPVKLICFSADRHTQALVFPVPYKFAYHCRIRLIDFAVVVNLITH